MPRVSVLMPVFNGQDELAETIDSILAQTLADWECVAVDDGSTDRTAQILDNYAARDPRFLVLHTPNQGITKALNAGIAKLSGEFVARLDCGDLCAPRRFERQTEFLDTHPEVVAVGSYASRISPEGWPIDVYAPPLTHDEIDGRHIGGGSGGIVHVAAMIRTEALRKVHGYCEDFRYAQDTDLWLRLAETGCLANIPEVLLTYRLDLTGISATKREAQTGFSREAVRLARERRGLTSLDMVPHRWIPKNKLSHMYSWVDKSLQAGNFRTAKIYAWRIMFKQPSAKAMKLFIVSLANEKRWAGYILSLLTSKGRIR